MAKLVGFVNQETYNKIETARYNNFGSGNAVKLLQKVDNFGGYIKLYSELDSHFEVNDIIYISYKGDSSYYFSNNGSDQFTLDNEILAKFSDNYPYYEFKNGYLVLDVNQNENSFVINKIISDIPINSLLNNHYASKVKCNDITIYNGSLDGVLIYNANISSATYDSVDLIQSVVFGGDIKNTTIKNKYKENYISLFCTYNQTNNIITKNVNFNNTSLGYSYFYDLSNSIKNCNIESGVYSNCNLQSNIGLLNINNGYYSGCTFNNYNIYNGIFHNCFLNNLNFYNGTWRNPEMNIPFPSTSIWYNGIFDSGVFNGNTWHNGVFNSGNFGIIGGNKTTWYDGSFNNGSVKNTIWYNGVFNNGTIEYSSWYDGSFNNGTIKNSTWYNGTFKSGEFIDSQWYNGKFNNGSIHDSTNVSAKTYILNGEFNGGDISSKYILGGTFNAGNIKNSNIYDANIFGSQLYMVNMYDGVISDTLLTEYSTIKSSITFASEVLVKPHSISSGNFVKFEFKNGHDFISNNFYNLITVSGFSFNIVGLDKVHRLQSSPSISDTNYPGGINNMLGTNYIVTTTPFIDAYTNARGFIIANVKKRNRITINKGTFNTCNFRNSDIYDGNYYIANITGDTNFYNGNFYSGNFLSIDNIENNWYNGNFYNGIFGYKTTEETISEENTNQTSNFKIVSVDAFTKSDGTKDPSILIFELSANTSTAATFFNYLINNLKNTNPSTTPIININGSNVDYSYYGKTIIKQPYDIKFPGTEKSLVTQQIKTRSTLGTPGELSIYSGQTVFINDLVIPNNYVFLVNSNHILHETFDAVIEFDMSITESSNNYLYVLANTSPFSTISVLSGVRRLLIEPIPITIPCLYTNPSVSTTATTTNFFLNGQATNGVYDNVSYFNGGSIGDFKHYKLSCRFFVTGSTNNKISYALYSFFDTDPNVNPQTHLLNATISNLKCTIGKFFDISNGIFSSDIKPLVIYESYNYKNYNSTYSHAIPITTPISSYPPMILNKPDIFIVDEEKPYLHHNEKFVDTYTTHKGYFSNIGSRNKRPTELGSNFPTSIIDLNINTAITYAAPTSATTIQTYQPWYCNNSINYANKITTFNDMQYYLINIYDNQTNFYEMSNNNLKVAFKFPIMQKYIDSISVEYPSTILGLSIKNSAASTSLNSDWQIYWQRLSLRGWYYNIQEPGEYFSRNGRISYSYMTYKTHWIVLPGLIKLPWIENLTAETYKMPAKLYFNYKHPLTSDKIKDNWSGGTFNGGTFNGKWYDPKGVSTWKGGNWNLAYNSTPGYYNNIAPNVKISNKINLNKNQQTLIDSNRFYVMPPWTKKDTNDNIVDSVVNSGSKHNNNN